MSVVVEVAAEAVVALLALTLAVDGARKVRNVAGFRRWLVSGNLTRVARPPAVVALGLTEVTLGAACVWPAGRVAAIVAVVAVTPIGAVLVRRTGVCACRGVISSQTPRDLVARNGVVVLALAWSLLVIPGPVRPVPVLLVAVAWAAVVSYRFAVLWRAPVSFSHPEATGSRLAEVVA